MPFYAVLHTHLTASHLPAAHSCATGPRSWLAVLRCVNTVMLLMTSGRVVYCGKTADVLPFVKPYFRPWEAWENPMDYILEFLCQLQPDQAEQVRCLPASRCMCLLANRAARKPCILHLLTENVLAMAQAVLSSMHSLLSCCERSSTS